MSQPDRILALSKMYKAGQTTVPAVVRRMLKLNKGNHMAWVLEDGDIVIRKGFYKVVRRT